MPEAGLAEKLDQILNVLLNDFESAPDYLSEDVVWVNYLPEHIPFGGEYRGLQGIADYLEQLAATLDMGELEFEERFVTTAGELIVTGTEHRSLVRATGKHYTMPFVWVLRFDEAGKMIYLREHNDTRGISEAFITD